MTPLPITADELIARSVVVSLRLREPFRGITFREAMLFPGPHGWGEFAPFVEYDDETSAPWLAAGLEAAFDGYDGLARRTFVPVNATVPDVDAADVPQVLARFPGADTAKIKVAAPHQDWQEDVARVRAVRARIGQVRIDANGGWSVDAAERVITALLEGGPLQYVEQPCASVDELAQLRDRLGGATLIAADESIRRAADPLAVVRAGAADVAVVKAPPLGGVRNVVAIAEQIDIPVVVSSALDTAIGMNAGLACASALPKLPLACGLGTGGMFYEDVAAGREYRDGGLSAAAVAPDIDRLARLRASDDRVQWWQHRARRCMEILGG